MSIMSIMSKKFIYSACFVLALSLTAGVAVGGVEYAEPLGGWTYIYTGEQAQVGDPDGTQGFNALDGTWSHENGSDEFDITDWEIGGGGEPGGIKAMIEGDVTFLRLQDCGDPRDYDMPDPSIRKIFLGHLLINDGVDQATADQILSEGGITISFRARLATTEPLDGQYADEGGENAGVVADTPWPAGGNGYTCHDGGKDIFGVHQEAGGDQTIGFALTLPSDPWDAEADYMEGRQGLTMNCLAGTSPSGDVDVEGGEGTLNILDIADLTLWHEFWITIEPDDSGGGTHKVNIWMDGSPTPNEFHVTAGTGGDYTESYISMGVGDTNQQGAIDVDFFGYKEGLFAPAPADPERARAVAPTPGTTVDLPDARQLGWIAGESAIQNDVYFGTNSDDVNNADVTDTTGIYRGRQELVIYTVPEAPELGQSYYWRIDGVWADDTIYKGDVWSFTVIDHFLVDDFEDYNDYSPDEIFSTWLDGYEIDTNGALVGHDADFSRGEHIVETTIVHGGKQSMPYYYSNIGAATYSEAERAFSPAQDWTREGVGVLSLWFRGHPAYMGSFIEGPTGTYTMTAEGTDIWGNSDEFHFAWKELSGAGSIVAKVESVENTHEWAKAGVMIRDTLDADSRHAMMVVTPAQGVSFQRRTTAGDSSSSDTEAGITAPQWVKLERTVGGLVRAYYSADGSTWTQLSTPQTVTMNMPMYVGLALTSHNPGVACEAKFSNVTSDGTGQWVDEDIGLLSNEAEPIYVTVKDSSGTAATVYNDDPDASQVSTWTEWRIDLKEVGDASVILTDVSNLAIGFGGADDPQPGGSGLVFFDDIRLYPPAEQAP